MKHVPLHCNLPHQILYPWMSLSILYLWKYFSSCFPEVTPSTNFFIKADTKETVSDGEAGGWLNPEGNGVNTGGGNGRGPGPPGGEQDKQLITSRVGGNILMEQQGRREEESGVTKRTHRAQSTLSLWMFTVLYVKLPMFHNNLFKCLTVYLLCFRRINHLAINHLHSSSDVRHHHV